MKKIFTVSLCTFLLSVIVSACSDSSSRGSSAISTYTVTYDDNGASGGTVPVDESTYTEGRTVWVRGNTGSLEKTWNNFIGWNTMADGSGMRYTQGQGFDMESSDIILYAEWETRCWGIPELIETDNSGDAFGSQAAVDGESNVIVVWYQSNGSVNNILANRYIVGTGWGMAELIENDGMADLNNPQVAVDPNGNAIVVWYQNDGTRTNIWANSYIAGTGWGTAELIETDNTGANGAKLPQVAFDGDGNAIAVWEHEDGELFHIWANRFE